MSSFKRKISVVFNSFSLSIFSFSETISLSRSVKLFLSSLISLAFIQLICPLVFWCAFKLFVEGYSFWLHSHLNTSLHSIVYYKGLISDHNPIESIVTFAWGAVGGSFNLKLWTICKFYNTGVVGSLSVLCDVRVSHFACFYNIMGQLFK